MPRRIYLIRHGETEWSASGQHTGLTDIPLTDAGVKQAKALHKRLNDHTFDHILTSPLKRAHDTCNICGYGDKAEISDDLLEWNYGDYEGITTNEIHKTNPKWNVFTHGGPNGETVEDVQKRADHLIEKLLRFDGEIALFSSGHFSRALTVRYLQLPLTHGQHFSLSTASLSILGYERKTPALILWNDTSHIHAPFQQKRKK